MHGAILKWVAEGRTFIHIAVKRATHVREAPIVQLLQLVL